VLELSQWRRRRVARPAGRHLEKTELSLGFIPLTDCAPLVAAQEKGFFREQGLRVSLSRESSWANIRDKVSVGMLDGAQMLAGMPLAAACGLEVSAPLVTALNLDLNGNAITVSHTLYRELLDTKEPALTTPLGSARALKQMIEERRATGDKPLVFAMVSPVSSHNYLLRYWMATAGIDPDRDLSLTVVPPPHMVNYLRAGVISGFCVGEPWNTEAVQTGLGRTLVTSYDLWNNHPEKVLGVTRGWAAAHPNTHQALLRALLQAGAWLDRPDNRREICALLSQGRYVNCPEEVLAQSMTGTFRYAADAEPLARPDFNVFHRYAAGFPWCSHALWLLTQMVRWRQLRKPIKLAALAESVYRPDLYRQAAAALGLEAPVRDYKVEGIHAGTWGTVEGAGLELGPDLFFDQQSFHPGDPVGYLKSLPQDVPAALLASLAQLNPPWGEAQRAAVLLEAQELPGAASA